MIVKGKTSSGFEFEIDERVAEDWTYVESLIAIETGSDIEKAEGLRNMMKIVLGKNEPRMYEHIRSMNDGFIPTSVLSNEVGQIVKALKESKNL